MITFISRSKMTKGFNYEIYLSVQVTFHSKVVREKITVAIIETSMSCESYVKCVSQVPARKNRNSEGQTCDRPVGKLCKKCE